MKSEYPTIIGITGRKYNGKDTVADYLVSEHGYMKISLADPLKEICRTLFGFTTEQLYGEQKEIVDPRWNISPRQALQYVGTELFRNHINGLLPDIGENFWIISAILKIKAIITINPDAKFVISDIRFPNEIELLDKIFMERDDSYNIDVPRIWRISRPSIEINDASVHDSERLIDTLNVDKEILNDSDLDSLYRKIEELLIF
jgi:hypothetical protein